MPIYEYKCSKCKRVFEEWVKSYDTTPQTCPDCGSSAPHIVSNTTFVLKGGGWYATEYGNRHSSDSQAVAAPSDSSSSGDSAAKSDAPPAAAASSTPAPAASSTPAPAASSPSAPSPAA